MARNRVGQPATSTAAGGVKKVPLLYDLRTRKVGCVLMQAVFACPTGACHLWDNKRWMFAPSSGLVCILQRWNSGGNWQRPTTFSRRNWETKMRMTNADAWRKAVSLSKWLMPREDRVLAEILTMASRLEGLASRIRDDAIARARFANTNADSLAKQAVGTLLRGTSPLVDDLLAELDSPLGFELIEAKVLNAEPYSPQQRAKEVAEARKEHDGRRKSVIVESLRQRGGVARTPRKRGKSQARSGAGRNPASRGRDTKK